MMKYQDLFIALEVLSKYYPGYQSNHLLVLCDDIIRWFNNDLPEDSSAIVYLKGIFASPMHAINALWDDVQLLSQPFRNSN
jgi:hypothetical protein